MQRGGALGADVVCVGEILIERDACGREVVEEVADDRDGVLVEVDLEHAVA